MDYGRSNQDALTGKTPYANGICEMKFSEKAQLGRIMKAKIPGQVRTGSPLFERLKATHQVCRSICLVLALSVFAITPHLKAATDMDPDFQFSALHYLEVYASISGTTNTLGSNTGGTTPEGDLVLAPEDSIHIVGKASPKISSSSAVIYGTASLGGDSGQGTIFSMNSDGTGYTVLHNFTGGADGGFPTAGLVLSGNTLYGTTVNGGSTDNGTVFAINTNKTGFTVLHNFTARNSPAYTNSDGGNPYAALILSGNTLYGTTSDGGTGNAGTVFALNLANTNFSVLHRFTKPSYDANFILTNSDGALPMARLVLSGQTLYGTTSGGGLGGVGTLFAVTTNGSNFTVLHSFSALDPNYSTNSDGTSPSAGLIMSGATLYGTAYQGGSANAGTVFSVSTNGANFTNLYTFTGGTDGFKPSGDLLLSGNSLFGTTRAGGNPTIGNGTVFALNTDGSNFKVVYTFSAGNYDPNLPPVGNNLTNSDGAVPQAGLVSSGGTLYGTTTAGGTGGNGTLFSLTPAILGIQGIRLSGTNLVINGSNGKSNGTYVTWLTTNLFLPLTQWTPIATNTLNASGNFTFTATNAVDSKAKQRFYILQGQ